MLHAAFSLYSRINTNTIHLLSGATEAARLCNIYVVINHRYLMSGHQNLANFMHTCVVFLDYDVPVVFCLYFMIDRNFSWQRE